MINKIMQGDQYGLPVSLKYEDGQYLTPDNTYEVIIQINDKPKKKSLGELEFNEATNEWIYPILNENSKWWHEYAKLQVQWQIAEGSIIRHTDILNIKVGDSIIRTPGHQSDNDD